MTSQQDQIQSLIADVDQALGAPKPRKPWIKASEVEPQRRALSRVQDYLKSLQQILEAPGGWGPVDPTTGQIASQQNSPRVDLELASAAGESAENLLQGLLTEMSFLKSSALEPLRLEMNSLREARDSLQQEVQALAEQREAAAAQYRAELEAALKANRQAGQRQEEIFKQEAIAQQSLVARQEELARQEEAARQAAIVRQEAIARQEESAQQSATGRLEEITQREESARQAAIARQQAITQLEELARQAAIARQSELAQREESDRQAAIARQEAITQQEENAQQAALARLEEITQREASARQETLNRQAALAQQEENAQQAALIRQAELTQQQEELTRQEKIARQQALARQEDIAQQAALARQEELARQEVSAEIAEQQLNQFLAALMERLQENLSVQVTRTLEQLEADHAEAVNKLTAAETERLQLDTNGQIEELQQLQSQSDQLLVNIDSTLQRMFETLQRNIDSYQISLNDGVENMHSLGREGEGIVRSLVDHLTEQLGQAAAPQPAFSPPDQSAVSPTEAPLAPETVTSLNEIFPEDAAIAEDETAIASETDELQLEDCIQEDGTIDLDLLRLDIDRSDEAAELTLTDLTVEPMAEEEPAIAAQPTDDDIDTQIVPTDDAMYLANLTLDDLTLDQSLADLDLADDLTAAEVSDPDLDANLDLENYSTLLEQPAPDIPDQPAESQTPDSPAEEETELAEVLPDFGSAYDSTDDFDVAIPATEPATVTTFSDTNEETEPDNVSEEPEDAADLLHEQPESALVPDIPEADDDTELLDEQTDVPSDDLVAVLAAVSRDSEQIAMAEADSDLTTLTSDLEEATVSEAAVPVPVTLSQETQSLDSAMIPDQPEAELENAPEVEWESDPQSGIEVELEAGFQNGIEVELEDRPESEFEFELENELQVGIEVESETRIDSEPEPDLENELEFGLRNEPQNELEIAPENSLENVFEGDDEVEDKTEPADSQPDSLLAESLPLNESLSDDDDDDWAALEEILDEPSESSLDSDLIELSGSVETVSPYPEDFDDDLDFYSAVDSDADLRENSGETLAATVTGSSDGDGDEDDDALADQPTEWFLGIDLGTTGLSAVLINQLGGQVYPLCWNVAGDDQGDRLRLPAVAQVVNGEDGHLGAVGPAALQEGDRLLRHIKPLVKIGIPREASGEPLIQWSDQVALPLLTVQTALVDLLKTLSLDGLSCYARELKERTLRTALAELKGVMVGYPNNWPDTYSFNVREAVLAAGLVSRPDQVLFVEEAIAALLSVLPDPQIDSELFDDQQPGLYNCNWSGGTVVISAGATLTEAAITKLPTELDQLSYYDFALRSFAYAGDSIDQDIICQLLHPPAQNQLAANTDAAEAGEADTWQSLELHRLNLPQTGEVDRIKRHRLRQRLNDSALGRQALAAAHQIKLALQEEKQFDLSLGGQNWTIYSQDLESKIFIPYVQRINRQVSGLLSQTGLSDQAVKQVVCTGGSASLRAIASWLRQKFPNATIIQDTYSGEYSNGGSRVAYGLANLCHYPGVLDANRHQYNDYYLLAELLRILPDQPLPAGGILHLLARRGIDTQLCQSHILALIEGHLPPGLIPAESDRPLISARSSETATYQMLAELPLFRKQGGQIYIADPQQGVRLRTHLESLLATKAQSLQAPLTVEMAAERV